MSQGIATSAAMSGTPWPARLKAVFRISSFEPVIESLRLDARNHRQYRAGNTPRVTSEPARHSSAGRATPCVRARPFVKRILFLAHTPFVGGAQLALCDHIRHLDRARFEPQVLCAPTVPEFVEQMRRQDVRIHLLDWPRLRQPTPLTFARVVRAGSHLRKVIRERDIDLVVANTSRTAYTAAVSMLGSPVPLVWWVRDFDFGRRVFRALGRVPSRIIFVSNALRSHYERLDDSRCAVVYVGNDLYERLGTYSPDQVRAARAQCGFSADDVVVGFMGRLV